MVPLKNFTTFGGKHLFICPPKTIAIRFVTQNANVAANHILNKFELFVANEINANCVLSAISDKNIVINTTHISFIAYS